ncbi:T6SS immunity protein Tli4 family protein [Photorhabdus hainanensis]|uniref:T6SS immunity protein Tli4 family protein n=1 Tax=Photorhabdus hainanensis TaxID=1004166 RepID=UPI001FEC3C49|nr:T6SS immunity protein Tli4 family protein [Photorhabdus hainanensis]
MNRKTTLLTLAVIYTLWWYMPVFYYPILTEKEKKMTTEMLANMQTRCVGRYLIDLPAGFDNVADRGIFIGDAQIETERLYPPAFEQRIQLREQKLKEAKTIDPKDMPFLRKVYRLQDNLKGVIFEKNEDIDIPSYARVLEAHLYNNGVAFTITMKFMDLSDEKYARDRAGFIKDGFSEDKLKATDRTMMKMRNLLSRISGRKDTEIPTEAGTCIPDGFITGSRDEKENMTFIYERNESDHFTFSIEILNDLQEKDHMLDRIVSMEGVLLAMHTKLIRKGKREIHGTYTEEILAKVPTKVIDQPEIEIPGYVFNLVANETAGDYKNPFVNIELTNDRVSATPFSENELIKFWDAVTSTFRKRPGAFKRQ